MLQYQNPNFFANKHTVYLCSARPVASFGRRDACHASVIPFSPTSIICHALATLHRCTCHPKFLQWPEALAAKTTPSPCHDLARGSFAPGRAELSSPPSVPSLLAALPSAPGTGVHRAPPPVGALPRPPVPAPPARTGCAMAAELACRDASSGTGHQALKSPSSSQHTRAQAPRTQPHGIWKLLHGTPTLIDEAEETRKIEEPLVGRGNLPGCWRGYGDLLKTRPPTSGPAARPCLHPRR